jgi:catecholate siderophore receptor
LAKARSPRRVLPLGALLLAGSFGAPAQTPPDPGKNLPTVTVKDQAEPAETKSKSTMRAKETSVAKGKQELRDVPQTVTVITEMVMDDRNLDDFREVLKTVSGVTFQAGETGEEDIRLRGFSLGQAGDIYVDGLKDAPLIERDTFNLDRVEVLKGSASMLFGKGSTGGVVNQVSKQPFLVTRQDADLGFGTGREVRATGDFNVRTGEASALRVNVMAHDADNYGATKEKKGIAPTYRWGIGLPDEFSVGAYYLDTDSRPLYNHPWFLRDGKIVFTLPSKNYYGLASDYLRTESANATFGHVHRFDAATELKTTVRHGNYDRELWSSVIGFAPAAEQPGAVAPTAETVTGNSILQRTPKGRVAETDLTQLQSELTTAFQALGATHDVIAGIDLYWEDAKRANNYAGAQSGLRTFVGTPNDGDSRDDTRTGPIFNTFDARNFGLYAQDTINLTPRFKVVAGLRFDRFEASYQTAAGTGPGGVVVPPSSFETSEGLWSPRLGALYQPDDRTSWYASYGTSYNTSADTYQYTPGNPNLRDANTPPEKSRNFEVGGKFELFNNNASLNVAVFHSEKYNERNTDPDTAALQNVLSGKRHATGMEFGFAGRLAPKWDVFWNYTWIPGAEIDESNVALNATGTGAQVEGDRPGLTPKHSMGLWTTWRALYNLRVGAGLNYRSEQNPEGARHVTAPSFTTIDAMAEYSFDDDLSVKLNVTNLGDKQYADALYRGFFTPGATRSVQLSMRATF